MKRPLCIFVAPVLLTGCSIAFPLLGDTSEDVNHVEFMQSLKTKADVLAAFQMPDTAREFHAEGGSVTCWHSHNLDFSDNSKRNRLTVYGSLIDLGLMFLAGAMQ